MLGRVITTGVVVFWVTMMAALIRTEYWPSAGPMNQVPPELVLRKVFAQETARLNIFYQGQDIGSCFIDITPLTAGVDAPADAAHRVAYKVHTDVKLELAVFNQSAHLAVESDSFFNRDYGIERFNLRTTVADGRVEVRGDALSRKLWVDFGFGDQHQQRVFDFQELRGAGLAGVLGLTGFAGLEGVRGGDGRGGNDEDRAAAAGRQPQTSIILSALRLGGVSQRAYLVDTRLDDTFWARLWVSQQGQILKVDTSLGINLLADVYTPETLEED